MDQMDKTVELSHTFKMMKANIAHYKRLGDRVAEQNCRNFLKLYLKNCKK